MMGTTDLTALKPVLLSPDGAAMRARRVIEGLLRQEGAAADLRAAAE